MESCSWPDHLPSDRRRAIAELVKGRDFALQLRDLVHSNNNNVSVSLQQRINQDLVLNILNSFTNTLSILKRSNGESDEVSQVPTPTHFTRDADVPLKSEDSEGSSKTTSTIKDRRGCYKRRRYSDSFTKETPTLVDDGHAWRKYGQKVILNAKYPRNYFRCTHKLDQGCQATKQVQQTEDNPPLYRSTYYGHHTCKNLLKASVQLLCDSSSKDQSSMISFGNNTHFTDKHNTHFSLPFHHQ
ncbi:probable WRKY transcription factor 70 [Mangifera indica]|uniref:probable WRKY transcription factor 70 n=1 Tax=Mangifera indica TaxID=29780 RepID=UPI001CFAC6D9|nr:probable WRKY transcription factor 70 [Mangifera indica]